MAALLAALASLVTMLGTLGSGAPSGGSGTVVNNPQRVTTTSVNAGGASQSNTQTAINTSTTTSRTVVSSSGAVSAPAASAAVTTTLAVTTLPITTADGASAELTIVLRQVAGVVRCAIRYVVGGVPTALSAGLVALLQAQGLDPASCQVN